MKKYIYLLIITILVSIVPKINSPYPVSAAEADKSVSSAKDSESKKSDSEDGKKDKSDSKDDKKTKDTSNDDSDTNDSDEDDNDEDDNDEDDNDEDDNDEDDNKSTKKDDDKKNDEDDEEAEEIYQPKSKQMLVVDLNNDMTLFARDEDKIINPGSLVKIVTAITALDLCKNETKKKVTIPDNVLEDYSRADGNIGLLSGEVLTLEELIECMLLADAGDCAFALAHITAKSYDEFVDKMNETAKKAGAEDSIFTDPTGCESDRQKTTLRDMYLITKYALQNEKFAAIVKTNGIEIAANKKYNKKRYIFNTNQFVCKYYSDMHYNPYMEGVKGYVNTDDDCGMVAKYTVGNTNLLLLCSGSEIEEQVNYSYNDIEYLVEYVQESFTEAVIVKKEEFMHEVKLTNAKDTNRILLASSTETRALLPLYYDQSKITKDITVKDKIRAPIKKGTVLGKMTVYYDGIKCGEADLVAYNDVESSMAEYLKQKLDTILSSMYFKAFIILCIGVFVALTVIRNKKKRKKKS